MTIRESYTAQCDCCGEKATVYAMNQDEAMKVFRHNLGWSLVVQEVVTESGEKVENLLYTFCSSPCLGEYTSQMEELGE